MLRILPITLHAHKVVASGDNNVFLGTNDVQLLNAYLNVGDSVLLTLQDQRGWETVRYTHPAVIVPLSAGTPIAVDRALHNTVRKSWPVGQCLMSLNTEGVLREFICQERGAC